MPGQILSVPAPVMPPCRQRKEDEERRRAKAAQEEELRRAKAAQEERRRRCEALRAATDGLAQAVEAGDVPEARQALGKLMDPQIQVQILPVQIPGADPASYRSHAGSKAARDHSTVAQLLWLHSICGMQADTCLLATLPPGQKKGRNDAAHANAVPALPPAGHRARGVAAGRAACFLGVAGVESPRPGNCQHGG